MIRDMMLPKKDENLRENDFVICRRWPIHVLDYSRNIHN